MALTVEDGAAVLSGSANKIKFTSGQFIIDSGNFQVTDTGQVTAKNLIIEGGSIKLGTNFEVTNAGAITAKSGNIGDFVISNGSIASQTYNKA
jgi:hypothetical protein